MGSILAFFACLFRKTKTIDQKILHIVEKPLVLCVGEKRLPRRLRWLQG